MGIVVLQCSCCGKRHSIEYTAYNVLQTVRSGWNSFGSALYCPDCVKTWEEYNGKNKPLWGDDHTIKMIDEQYSCSMSNTVTEFCSECESEVTFGWDVGQNGFKAYCPVCGSRLMLCDECIHKNGICDYDSGTGKCCLNSVSDE